MFKGVQEKVNHLIATFTIQGFLLIALGAVILIVPQILVWAIVVFIFFIGLASLYVAYKLHHLKTSVTKVKFTKLFK